MEMADDDKKKDDKPAKDEAPPPPPPPDWDNVKSGDPKKIDRR